MTAEDDTGGQTEFDAMPDTEVRVSLVGKINLEGPVKVGDLISLRSPVFIVRSAGRKHRAGADDPISDPKASAQLSTHKGITHEPQEDDDA